MVGLLVITMKKYLFYCTRRKILDLQDGEVAAEVEERNQLTANLTKILFPVLIEIYSASAGLYITK